MKTEDELDAKIAKLVDEGTTTTVEMVNGKRRVTDEETIAQMEREENARRMEEVCGMFLTAERRFEKLNSHPDKVTDPKVNLTWGIIWSKSTSARKSSGPFRGVSAHAGAEQAICQVPHHAPEGQ